MSDFERYGDGVVSAFRYVPRSGLSLLGLRSVAAAVDVFEREVLARGFAVGLRYPLGSGQCFSGEFGSVSEVWEVLERALRDVGGFDEVDFLDSGVGRGAFRVRSSATFDGVFVVKYEFTTLYAAANLREVQCLLQAASEGYGRVPALYGWGARWLAVEFIPFGSYGEGSGVSGDLASYLYHNFAGERDMIQAGLESAGLSVRDLHPGNLRRRHGAGLQLVAVDLGHCFVDWGSWGEDDLFDWGFVDDEGCVRVSDCDGNVLVPGEVEGGGDVE